MQGFVLVGIGGALGSMARYGLGLFVGRLFNNTFPLATLLINISGSFVMGLFVGMLAKLMPEWGDEARLFIAVGILGGFTTFSSFSLDTITMLERGEVLPALTYVLLSVVISVPALYLGLLITRGAV